MERFNNLNLNYIKYFNSVAKHKNISKAAESLGVSQSALSQAMKNLEEELGVTLFNRNTRGIVLTNAGNSLYKASKPALDMFKQSVISAKQIDSNFENVKFRIAISRACFNFCFLDKANNIISSMPEVSFDFHTSVSEIDAVKRLQNNEIDLVFFKASTTFKTKEVECKEIMRLKYVMAYSPNFFDFNGKFKIEDLKFNTIIIKSRDGRRDSSWQNYSFSHIVSCSDDITTISLIKEGAGIGLVPQEMLAKYGLKQINLLDAPKQEVNLVACYNFGNKYAKKILELIKA